MARVLVLSDLHIGAGRVRGVSTRAGLVAALAHARARGPYAHTVLNGDLVDKPRPETYAALYALVADQAPLVLAGNHDDPAALRAVFPPRPEGDPAAVSFVDRAGGFRLVGVNTHLPGRVKGRVGPGHLAWLARVLDEDPRPVVLFLHHPPINLATIWLDPSKLDDAPALAQVVARSGRVRLIVHGHAHMASDGFFAGVRTVGAPSTAFRFIAGSLLPGRGPATPGYRVLDLGEDGGRCETEVTYLPEIA